MALADVKPEAAKFYAAAVKIIGAKNGGVNKINLPETDINTGLGMAVESYTDLIALPKELLPDVNLKSLTDAYRVYEANATPENASKFMNSVDESIGTVSENNKAIKGIDTDTASAVARVESIRGQIIPKVDNITGNMLKSTGKDIARTKVNYGDQYISGKKGRIELKPDIEYTTPEGYNYSTDDLGRINNAEGILVGGEADRNTYAQSVAGREDRLPTDEGGHLIARIFKGSGDLDNLVPMNATLNRGDWKAMENGWKNALDEGKEVKVRIQPIYEGSLQRPVSFKVRYTINGQGFKFKEFDN